jgi:hypothetical protein
MLELIGVKINRQTETTDCAGIPLPFGPKILLEPSFALTLADLRLRFEGKTTISENCTIILGGAANEQPIKNLTLDGTLIAYAPVNFFAHFNEAYIVFGPVACDDEEKFRIRGYKPEEKKSH